MVEAYYELETHSLHVLKRTGVAVPDGTKLHEMVHALQANLGYRIDPGVSVTGYIVSKLMAEAGANAVTLVIAHKMKENGHPEAWNSFRYETIATRFSDVLAQNRDLPADVAYKKAAQSAWHAFFERKTQIRGYTQAALIEAAMKLEQGKLSHNGTPHDALQGTLQACGTLPSGSRFLDGSDMPRPETVFLKSRAGKEAYLLALYLESRRAGDDEAHALVKTKAFIDDNKMNPARAERNLQEWGLYLDQHAAPGP